MTLASFRPGAGPGVGLGHVARCLTLADEWVRRGGTAELVVAAPVPALWSERARASDIAVVGLPTPDPAWVIVDDYEAVVPRLRSGRLLVIDDHGSLGPLDADLRLDQNLDAPPTAGRGRRLSGPSFVLLRREFPTVKPTRPDARVVLVSGGGQPTDAVRALVDEITARLRAAQCTVVPLQGVADVAATMGRVDVGVTAAGGTAYELAATGTPAVLFAVADNQEPVSRGFGRRDAALDLGRDPSAAEVADAVVSLLDDPARRSALADVARALVDGGGAARVVAHMRSFDVHLRRAEAGDREQLYEWSNDPETRRRSFATDPIGWSDHVRWFDRQLADPDRVVLIAEADGAPLGPIRFAYEGDEAVVSFSIAPDRRNQGWAAPLLIGGAGWVEVDRPDLRVVGHVKANNAASLAAFSTAGIDAIVDES